jgi:hypothetical protein
VALTVVFNGYTFYRHSPDFDVFGRSNAAAISPAFRIYLRP